MFVTESSEVEFVSYAEELIAHKGSSLVISGTNDLNIQLICNAINNLLGNYGTTINTDKQYNLKQGDDQVINKLIAKIDYFPEWADFSNYRLVSDVAWEYLLDEDGNLSLKLGANDRYDSTPNGREANDVDQPPRLLLRAAGVLFHAA